MKQFLVSRCNDDGVDVFLFVTSDEDFALAAVDKAHEEIAAFVALRQKQPLISSYANIKEYHISLGKYIEQLEELFTVDQYLKRSITNTDSNIESFTYFYDEVPVCDDFNTKWSN